MNTEVERFRAVFRRAHSGHAACHDDEWLSSACRAPNGSPLDRPLAWSRRNGPWHAVDITFVGAAPGNAGGRGSGALGAHATRIPFGGDVAGANLDVLLGSIGINRNETFLSAALNSLPVRGGGEPDVMEIRAAVGEYPSSLHLLRDTLLATGARLIVALGNVALRSIHAATRLDADGTRLPSLQRLSKAGAQRNAVHAFSIMEVDDSFRAAWDDAHIGRTLPSILWLTHPSAQNMSPFARTDTLFHTRMLDARSALRAAVARELGWTLPAVRADPPSSGIYDLPEWRNLIAPHHARLDALWREKGV